MRYKKKLIILFILILVLTGIQFLLPYRPDLVAAYDKHIFRPYQSFRDIVFGFIPISIGDILYISLFISLVATIIKWLYYIIRFSDKKHALGHSLLRALLTIGTMYLLFFIGWGGNYYKPSLPVYWRLDKTETSGDAELLAFDSFLVQKMNIYAPHFHAAKMKDYSRSAKEYYVRYTNGKARRFGLKAKPSIFGYWMQHLGIQGYYNPFTGEAQVNKYQPAFMLPFVVSHEMAHQSGVAAEEDANLMAYVLGAQIPDSSFRYSAYFNIWLYTHSRLYRVDSAKANEMKQLLNPLSIAHLDTLRAIRQRYKSNFSEYGADLYDGYLKMHNQKDGIRSYSRVASSAWAWEQQISKDSVIHLP
jgi:hypothetical protein